MEIALLKVGSAPPPDMKGGNGTETAKQDIDAMTSLLKKGWLNATAFKTSDCAARPSKS